MEQSQTNEKIFVTGMAGIFPNSKDLEEFYVNLKEKKQLFGPVEPDHKIFLSKEPLLVGQQPLGGEFDAGFFDVNYKLAEEMYPSCRKLLELSVEAIIDSGTNPLDLKGSRTGVFLTSSEIESKNEWAMRKLTPPNFSVFGSSTSLLAERISYHLQLQGPAVTMDSGCASAIYLLDEAVKLILSGKCDSALVCGLNTVRNPNISFGYQKLGILARGNDGNVFNESSTGYIKSEATAVIFLQKLQDAKRVYGEILNVKTNCDGFKDVGMYHPSGDMIADVCQNVYDEVGIDPATVTFVECHVTGTKAGIVQEMKAIEKTFCPAREIPLLIGSLKATVGHCEPISGLVSLIKILFGLQHNCILPNPEYQKLNSDVVELHSGKIAVVTETISLPSDQDVIIGFSSFGFGGTNGHVAIRHHHKTRRISKQNYPNRLVCFSARTMSSLTRISNSLSDSPTEEYLNLLQNMFGRNVPNYCYRGYAITNNGHISEQSLERTDRNAQLCLVYPPGTKEWLSLLHGVKEVPAMSESITSVRSVLLKKGIDVLDLWSQGDALEVPDVILATVAFQIIITDMLKQLLRPPVVLAEGYSSGAVAAAYARETLELEDALMLTIELCRQLEENGILQTNCENDTIKLFIKNNFKILTGRNSVTSAINQLKLVIGPGEDDQLGFGSNTTLEQIFGRLYTSGFDLNLEKLYPNVSWPVRAQFISPLIQWRHEHDWHVPKYELKHLNKLYVTIALDHEWKFLSEHVIDGYNLCPGPAFLVVAWKCYLKLNHLIKSETKIVFENVKFQRMTVLTKQKPLLLTVEMAKVQNKFEIREGDECLVTGTIRSSPKNFDFITNRSKKTEKVMQTKDIYKKLGLHGYNYKGAFSCLQQVGMDGAMGSIKWSNWTAFLDAMQHFTVIVKDLNHLYVVTEIEKLVIDPQMHAQALIKYSGIVPVSFDKSSNTISAPGVEFRNVLTSKIQKRIEKEPVLEIYKFVPFNAELSLEDSVMIHVQLLVENLTNILSVVEVVDSFSNENFQLLCPVIENALKQEFRVQSNLSVFSSKSYKDLNIKVEHKTIQQLPFDLNLVILSQGSKRPEAIAEILQNNNCFVLSREVGRFESLDHSQVISVHRTNSEYLVLLRNSSDVSRTVIELDPDLMWLEQLQSRLNDNEKVLLVAQNDASNGVLGLVNCLKQELGQNVSCMFLQDNVKKFEVEDEIFQKQLRKDLLVNVLKDGVWGSYRHLPLHVITKDCFHAFCATSNNDLSRVHYVEGELLSDNETVVEVYYAGVNFKDVMIGTGKVNFKYENECRSKIVSLGIECAGIDARGRRLMVFAPCKAFSNFISLEKTAACVVPQEWTLEDAATVPVSYLTVLYALLKVCRLKRGQSVLVHSATGGVGQSAINICLHFNCNIFATTGSEEKRNYLKTLYPIIPGSQVGNSRDITFEHMVLKRTGGKGVDIVINSLSEEKLHASTNCLGRKGVFVELGKYDSQLNNPLSFDRFCDGRTYVGVHIDEFLDKNPVKLKQLTSLLERGIKEEYVKPLQRVVYDKEEIQDALRYMTLGQHTGKILLKFKDESSDVQMPMQAKPRFFCHTKKVYVIVGGLGGFGLELADWLIGRGAQKIVLVSRSGVTTGYQNFKLNNWKKLGCKILVAQDDLTTEKGCTDLLKKANALGVVDGLFNLALVLNDAFIENQTVETFNAVLAPKASITRNLDTISRMLCPDLRQFVVFSSYICGRGSSGLANYGMANSVAERICEQRKLKGYPALAIQWGIIGQVGIVAEKLTTTQHLDGVLEQSVSSCLDVIDTFLTQNEVIVSSTLYADKDTKQVSKSNEFLKEVADILAIANLEHVSMHSTLANHGMDSSSSVQLRQFLGTKCNMYFTLRELRSLTLHMLMNKYLGETN